MGERFGSGDGERKTLLTRQIAFEPLPASVLFGVVVGWSGRMWNQFSGMWRRLGDALVFRDVLRWVVVECGMNEFCIAEDYLERMRPSVGSTDFVSQTCEL